MDVQYTDAYFAVAFICTESDVKATVHLTGNVTLMQPYGFTPAEKYAYPPFYAALVAGYVMLLLWFLYRVVRNLHYGLLALHYFVGAVVTLGLVEVTVNTYMCVRPCEHSFVSCCGALIQASCCQASWLSSLSLPLPPSPSPPRPPPSVSFSFLSFSLHTIA